MPIARTIRKRRWGLVAASVSVMMLATLFAPIAALATITPTSATVNGSSSVTVAPGATISATFNVTVSSGMGHWHSSGWRISTTPPGSTTCVNHGNHNTNGSYSETFNVTAPATPGTYNAYFVAYHDNGCSSPNSTVITLTNAVTVSSGPANQTITFDPIADKTYDPTLAVPLTATATSGLTVTFSSLTLGVCTVSGANAILGDGLGTCTIQADQAGNGSYNPAPSVTQSFDIGKADPDCTNVHGYSDTYDGDAHGADGDCLGVMGENLGQIGGLDYGASFTNVPGGTANWTYTDQTGFYNDASGSAAITIVKADPICTIVGFSGPYDGDPHGASGSCLGVKGETLAGLDLGDSFTNIPGGTAVWTFTDVTGNYNNTDGEANIVIGTGDQTITFGALADKPLGTAPFGVSATASSGLTVTFSSTTTGVCTVSGTTVTLVNVGTCTIKADQAGNGNWNAAPSVSQSFTVTGGGVSRIAGHDRYETAAMLSAATFDPGVPVVYIATGQTFPDALAAGPAAGHDGGPILLVTKDSIPASVATELTRLNPGRIVVLGGTGTISTAVQTALGTYTSGSVTRIAGSDRYQTASMLSAAVFPVDVDIVYIVTGQNYPDALAGGPAATHDGGPILLVTTNSIPASVAAELTRLNPADIVILGGTGTVSAGVQTSLAAYTSGTVTRIAGSDRYATAAALSNATFGTGLPVVYVATGQTFPDALAAGAAASADGSPILLVTKTSIPASVATELTRITPGRIVVLGGTGTVSAAVMTALGSYVAP